MTLERLTRWLLPLLWMALIFAMSSRSTIPKAPGISPELIAASGHLVVYAVLGVLLFRALGDLVETWAARAGLAWLLAVLYGITDEFHQSFVPGRFATLEDVLLDAAGAAIGLLLYRAATQWLANRQAIA